MQSNDARTLLQCAVPTAVVGAAAIVVGAVFAGGKGALGAAFVDGNRTLREPTLKPHT